MGARAAEHTLRVATFKADVTLPLGTLIYPSYKPLEVVEFPLLAKGVVLESAGTRYVLCAVDWCELRNSTYATWRQAIADAAETDVSRVALTCVHQHTAPIADGDGFAIAAATPDAPPCPTPESMVEPAPRVAEAVRAALANLQPVDAVGLGQGRVENVASNRRIPIGDGKVGFRGSNCPDAAMRALPEGLVDPYLKTITFQGGGRPIARLHYYAVHAQAFYGDPRASWDFPGIARERLEKEEGVFQVYFTGCAGDIAAGKYNDGTKEARAALAEQLHAGMARSVASTAFTPAERVEWRSAPVTFAPRTDDDEALYRAGIADPAKAHSVRIDNAMVLAWKRREPKSFDISAMRVGRAAVLHLPGEPMLDYQLFAQESRPDLFVAVSGYSDAAMGYICLEKSYLEGGYEPTASNLAPESEWVLKETIREVLDFA